MVCLINAEGRLIVKTIWAKTADRRCGPRETRFETVSDAADLQRRLGELVPALAWRPPPPASHPNSGPAATHAGGKG